MLHPKNDAKPGQATAVTDSRDTPLGRVSESAASTLFRIVRACDEPLTPPVAAFDASL
ncbi:hypothetical protein Caci_0511 [Catenulispora acidiphila DSM 44928]|uniref:FXSXX-COOH protein n=1 Tax=Catenulispora acidiphila (strain DSM 44928 / JCM 14897 / NBRC 102108 / NRRL B-24433 / ID139908) TaxID=479433 RepID=C7PXA6_CATAD|nr:hypothetical protein Caci_0511 [Catenulispora acidiphila DSM 44928]